jgi:hypothetical protein
MPRGEEATHAGAGFRDDHFATSRPTEPPRFWWLSDSLEAGAMSGLKYPNQLYGLAQHIIATAISQDPALSLNGAVIRIGPRVGVVPATLRG